MFNSGLLFSLHDTKRSLGDMYSLSYSPIRRWCMFKVMVLVKRQEKNEVQKPSLSNFPVSFA